MTYLLEEELTSQGIQTKTTLKIKLNNRVYVRVKTLPKQFYEQAEKIKNEYDSSNINTLFIEHKSWVAIWVEQKRNGLDRTESEYLYKVQNKHLTSEDYNYQSRNKRKRYHLKDEELIALQEITPKSSRERYRGVIYEDSFFENAYSTNQPPESIKSESIKSNKRYRGILYNEKDSKSKSPKVAKSDKFKRKYRGYTY